MAENRRRLNLTPPPVPVFREGGLAVESSLVPTPRPSEEERQAYSEERQRRIDEGLRQRDLGEQFGNIEFEADMYSKGFLDPLSRLGLDAEVAKTVPARYNRAGQQIRFLDSDTDRFQENRNEAGYTDPIEPGDVLTIGDFSGSNTVWAHEFRHRGMEKLRENFEGYEDFVDQYLPDADRDTRLVARLIFDGGDEEVLTDFMDRRSPEEHGFWTEILSDSYATYPDQYKEPVESVETAIMQAARDILTEEGSPLPAEMQEREEKGWLPRMIDSLFGRKEGYSKGGMTMDEEMKNLLEEGGLTDDGMERDPVSGNEVPPGSMAEEVRDDIPAQLSGGEYVVPADVVRYYGVKFFEDLRGEAKQGLTMMEDTGRIGGDSIPAEEIARREEVASEMGMSRGGFAPGGAVGTIANNLLQGYTATGSAQATPATTATTTPSYINEDGTVNYDLLAGESAQNMYLQTPYNSLADLFADFSQVGGYTQRMREGRPAPGAPTAPTGAIEYVPYVGADGTIMMIPFINGEPQIEIPEGFTPQGETQAPEVEAPATPTTTTAPSKGDDRVGDPDAPPSKTFQDTAREAYDFFSNEEDPIASAVERIGESPLPGGLGLIGGGINTIDALTDIAQARGYAMHIAESDPTRGQEMLDAIDNALDDANFGARALEGLFASGNRYKEEFDAIAQEGGTVTPPPAVTRSSRGVTTPSTTPSDKGTAPGSVSTPVSGPSVPSKTGGSSTEGSAYPGGYSDPSKTSGGGRVSEDKPSSPSSSGKASSRSSSSGKSSSSSSSSKSSGSKSSSSKSQPEDRGFGKAEGGLMKKPSKTKTKK